MLLCERHGQFDGGTLDYGNQVQGGELWIDHQRVTAGGVTIYSLNPKPGE